ATRTTHIYTPSLHDALPIFPSDRMACGISRRASAQERQAAANPVHSLSRPRQEDRLRSVAGQRRGGDAVGIVSIIAGFEGRAHRSEEHTSELQSRENLVCRL